MRFDVENQLSSGQSFTGAATVSTHSYEKQTAAQDLSIGRLMCAVFYPTVAAGSGSTHTFEVIQADAANLTGNVEVLATVVVLAANLTVGDKVVLPIPQGVMSRKYIGVRNSISGGTATITFDAYFMPLDEVEAYKSFPKVVNAAT